MSRMKKSLIIIITLAFQRHNTTPPDITFLCKIHQNEKQRKDSSSPLSTNKMTHYNKLSEVSYNPKIMSWRFRGKIHRIYHFYSYVTSSGPFYKYVLADEEGTKMEMTIYGNSVRF
ncbi:unnamed protein product [Brassica oleracea]